MITDDLLIIPGLGSWKIKFGIPQDGMSWGVNVMAPFFRQVFVFKFFPRVAAQVCFVSLWCCSIGLLYKLVVLQHRCAL